MSLDVSHLKPMGAKLISSSEESSHPIELYMKLGGSGKFLVHAQSFPVYCSDCQKTLTSLCAHLGSHYGHVGHVECNYCKQLVNLVDHDFVNFEIKMHSRRGKLLTVNFHELFHLTKKSVAWAEKEFGVEIFETQKILSLSSIVESIKKNGHSASPISEINYKNISFTNLPQSVQEWLGLTSPFWQVNG